MYSEPDWPPCMLGWDTGSEMCPSHSPDISISAMEGIWRELAKLTPHSPGSPNSPTSVLLCTPIEWIAFSHPLTGTHFTQALLPWMFWQLRQGVTWLALHANLDPHSEYDFWELQCKYEIINYVIWCTFILFRLSVVCSAFSTKCWVPMRG